MPLKKSLEEIEKYWMVKSTNPEVVKTRFVDVSELHKKMIKRATKVMFPVNDIVCKILDEYGIAGMRRLDYYAFARRIWKVYYTKCSGIVDKYIQSEKDYYKSTLELKEEIMDKIASEVKEFVNKIKIEEKKRMEEDMKIMLGEIEKHEERVESGSP